MTALHLIWYISIKSVVISKSLSSILCAKKGLSLTPASNYISQSDLYNFPLVGWQGRICRAKVRKLVAWEKGRLIGKGKVMLTSKAKQGIHSPLPKDRQVFSHPQESMLLTYLMVTWENKCHLSIYAVLPPSFPNFICWVGHHMVWDIPLVTGVICPDYVPSEILVYPQPWHCANTAQL